MGLIIGGVSQADVIWYSVDVIDRVANWTDESDCGSYDEAIISIDNFLNSERDTPRFF